MTQSICLLALPDAITSSLSLPLEMLNAAANFLSSRGERGMIDIRICSLDGQTVTMAGGLRLCADSPYREMEHCDWLILPTRWRHPLKALPGQATLLSWLQKLAQSGTRICTVSTGSFLLAEAGLLDGKPGTTHWHYFEAFSRRYPDVALKRDHLITEADGMYCAGSINSFADLMVFLIGETWGAAVARHVERQFSPEIRRPFQQHAYRAGRSHLHSDEAIALAQSWLRSHLSDELDMPLLAEKAGLSLRSFYRRFKQSTGSTPLQYLQQLRMDSARELLRKSNLSVAEIAQQVGYSDTSYFCKLLRQHSGQTPAEYRRTVRGKLFNAEA